MMEELLDGMGAKPTRIKTANTRKSSNKALRNMEKPWKHSKEEDIPAVNSFLGLGSALGLRKFASTIKDPKVFA